METTDFVRVPHNFYVNPLLLLKAPILHKRRKSVVKIDCQRLPQPGAEQRNPDGPRCIASKRGRRSLDNATVSDSTNRLLRITLF